MLERANIIPIYKMRNTNEPGNYRPVSLPCIVCKVMETTDLTEYLAECTVTNNSQHGFTKGDRS